MSQYPVINAGTTPTVAVLQAMLEQVGYKATDQGVTSSTVLQNDTALLVPVAANAKYEFDVKLVYKGGTTGSSDLKLGWAVPSGAVIAGGLEGVANPLGVALLYMIQTSVLFSATNGTGNPFPIRMWGTLTTSGTPGNMQLTWAQNTSSGTATTVMAGSLLTARRVG